MPHESWSKCFDPQRCPLITSINSIASEVQTKWSGGRAALAWCSSTRAALLASTSPHQMDDDMTPAMRVCDIDITNPIVPTGDDEPVLSVHGELGDPSLDMPPGAQRYTSCAMCGVTSTPCWRRGWEDEYGCQVRALSLRDHREGTDYSSS